jgi:ankyrin repeat protein
MTIFAAIENDCDIDAVLDILQRDPRQLKARSELKDTPLHVAASQGCTRIVQILLDRGADIAARGDRRYTPLHYAAQENQLDVIKLLVKRGANLEAADISGSTPLQSTRWDEARALLLKLGAKLDAQTAIIEHSNQSLPKLLKQARTSKSKTPAKDLQLLLYIAIANHNVSAVKALLAQGADPNRGHHDDARPPLHDAVSGTDGHPEIIKLLIDHGADVNYEIPDEEGPKSPLWYALEMRCDAGAELLRAAGAREPTRPIRQYDFEIRPAPQVKPKPRPARKKKRR